MVKKTNVVSLACYKVGRELQQLIKQQEQPFELDWADIHCPNGRDNLTFDAPIELGPTVRAQVQQLFAKFGLDDEPQTWGQLARNYQYCKQLNCFADSVNRGGDIETSISSAEKWWPGWGGRVEALALGKLDELRAIHKRDNVFVTNGLRENDNPYATRDRKNA